ncbi:hypothetical protein ASPCAL14962 [Aspergillus calidoustus]|uniref:Ankyrin repeat protein n=1 Tax=Aspergillus calidoustus TaxID=454130 RepID=A0A0U5GIG1_ASPCI|nr:hypothetical protein ASPCAL14962 [Aspergillus calidoustus]
MKGHVEAVEELVTNFGADVLLPIKSSSDSSSTKRSATLTLVLALGLPLERAKIMTAKLLQLGASPAQADFDHRTPLLYVAGVGHEDILDLYIHYDQPAVLRALNHLSVVEIRYRTLSVETPLIAAIGAKNLTLASRFLQLGARPLISFQEFMGAAQDISWVRSRLTTENRQDFEEDFDQPVTYAIKNDLPLLAMELLARDADPNTLTREGHVASGKSYYASRTTGSSLLDSVRARLAASRGYKGEKVSVVPPAVLDFDDSTYLDEFNPGTY